MYVIALVVVEELVLQCANGQDGIAQSRMMLSKILRAKRRVVIVQQHAQIGEIVVHIDIVAELVLHDLHQRA